MTTVAPMNIIYALHLRGQEGDVRYVGQTSQGATIRLSGHFGQAAIGTRFPVCNWLRKHGKSEVVMTVLEVLDSPSYLDAAESRLISHWREVQGTRLLNVKTGGGQSRGHKRTPEQIAAISGKNNSMYGVKRGGIMSYARSFQHEVSASTRALLCSQRKGADNSNAKLTEVDVRWIRKAAELGPYGTKSALARQYNVTPAQITSICLKQSWPHVI